MRKLLQLVLALSLAGGVLGAGGNALADHCETSIYVFSSTGVDVPDPTGDGDLRVSNPSVTSNLFGCLDQDAHYNTNWIYPLANQISVRFLENVGEDVLHGKVNGLGLEDLEIELVQGLDATGAPATFYDSQRIEIDPSETGELHVEIYIPLYDGEGTVVDIDVETETYRTIDQEL